MRRNRAALRRAVACQQANRRSREGLERHQAEARILNSAVLHLDATAPPTTRRGDTTRGEDRSRGLRG